MAAVKRTATRIGMRSTCGRGRTEAAAMRAKSGNPPPARATSSLWRSARPIAARPERCARGGGLRAEGSASRLTGGEDFPMIVGYHVIFGAYGFWLPNDPRGSWSTFVGAWDLFRYGPATATDERQSVAHRAHDRARR